MGVHLTSISQEWCHVSRVSLFASPQGGKIAATETMKWQNAEKVTNCRVKGNSKKQCYHVRKSSIGEIIVPEVMKQRNTKEIVTGKAVGQFVADKYDGSFK